MVSDANKNTPVLGCHGDADNVVSFKAGELALRTIAKFNPNTNFKVYIGIGHQASRAEIEEVFRFVNANLKSSE